MTMVRIVIIRILGPKLPDLPWAESPWPGMDGKNLMAAALNKKVNGAIILEQEPLKAKGTLAKEALIPARNILYLCL